MDSMGSIPISCLSVHHHSDDFDCDLDGHGDGDTTCKQTFHFHYGMIKNLSTMLFQMNPQAVDSINNHINLIL